MSWEWANAEEKSWCPLARSAHGAEPLSGVLGASLTYCSSGFGAGVLRMIMQSHTFIF